MKLSKSEKCVGQIKKEREEIKGKENKRKRTKRKNKAERKETGSKERINEEFKKELTEWNGEHQRN